MAKEPFPQLEPARDSGKRAADAMKSVDLADRKGSRQVVSPQSGKVSPPVTVTPKIERGTTNAEIVRKLRGKYGTTDIMR